MDKSWIKKSRRSEEYKVGVKSFISFAKDNSLSGNKIYCPCEKCFNQELLDPDDVYFHLMRTGFLLNYTKWIFHGECKSYSQVSSSIGLRHPASSSSSCRENLVGNVDLRGLLEDIGGSSSVDNANDNEPLGDPDIGDDQHLNEINEEHVGLDNDRFQRLLEDCDKELYIGCKRFTLITFLLRLYHIKCSSLPSSYYDAKKVINGLGLGYEKIHACKNDCMLFWGSGDDKKEQCDKCNASRWENLDNDSVDVRKKRKPVKILRYFPVQPRLERLYRSSKTALSMRWHSEGRTKDGLLRHPADALAWKAFDIRHPDFASDPRNVRLGLASDGFNPFRTMSTTYSTWPVLLVTYNMEPWACMKSSSTMLTMIIPGEKGPGNDIDVFLQPLVKELKKLWVGVGAYDAYTKQSFNLKAALLWTINDFPAYANLSGWSTKGKVACPRCLGSTHSRWLIHGRKFCYTGHRRWLESNHPYRLQKEQFDGTEELRPPPTELSGVDIERQMNSLNFSYGKASIGIKKRRRDENPINKQQEVEINNQECIFSNADDFIEDDYEYTTIPGDDERNISHLWKKRSIFFYLPYWKFNLLRHNLDVMHIEKNVMDNLIGTFLNIDRKSKDNENARRDLEQMGIREDLHPRIDHRGKLYLPQACYTLNTKEKDLFLTVLKNIKVPDGYASNIARCVNLKERKLVNLKSHDGHILMHDILPIALRATTEKPVVAVVSELSRFFKSLCSNTLVPNELDQMGVDAVKILCQMEKIFPPSFFTIMVHLIVHLVDEAKFGGPVAYRWMYPIERYLSRLKSHVKNKAYPEGSIAEGYIADECLTFISRYFDNVETSFNRQTRNNENAENLMGYMFNSGGQVLGSASVVALDDKSIAQAHRYVLLHYEDINTYRSDFLNEKRKAYLPNQATGNMEQKWLVEDFSEWLMTKVPMMMRDKLSSELIAIARGPHHVVRRFNSLLINGFRFHTKHIELSRKTQNSGVVVDVDEKPYFGVLTDIYELNYFGTLKVVIFRCDWVDVNSARGLKQDANGCTLVNLSRKIHTGANLKDDPFIFASQARQVFYVQDPKNNDWYHVIFTKPRDLYDMGETSHINDADIDEGHATYNPSIPTVIRSNELDNCTEWAREDIDS